MATVSVALVTDSTAYLPDDLRSRPGISVVPLHVILGGQEHQEGVDVTPDEVAAALRAYKPVSTSRPAPQAFLDAYRKAADQGAKAVVSVHISSALSSPSSRYRLCATSARSCSTSDWLSLPPWAW